MKKVHRHALVFSNLDCVSWPLPRALVALELSGLQRLLLCEEIGPPSQEQNIWIDSTLRLSGKMRQMPKRYGA